MRSFAVAILSSAYTLASARLELSDENLQAYVDSTLCESSFVGEEGDEDFTNLD